MSAWVILWRDYNLTKRKVLFLTSSKNWFRYRELNPGLRDESPIC